MPAERVSMRRVREILRLKHAVGPPTGRSRRSVGVARSTVALYSRPGCRGRPDLAAAGDADRPRARGAAVRRRRNPAAAAGARRSPTGPMCIASCAGRASR